MSLVYSCSKFLLSIVFLKMQRISMSFQSLFGALDDASGSWLGFGVLILIWIWSLVFDLPMFWILALHFDFEGAKIIHALQVLIWGSGGYWRFLTWVWYHDLDLHMLNFLWWSHDLNLGSLSWFWRCKENPCPFTPDWGFWGCWRFLIGVGISILI